MMWLRRLGVVVDAAATVPPEPSMYSPTSALVTFVGSRSATILPSNITSRRSARAITSSSSDDTIRTAAPLSRSSTIREWMYSIEPTSMPRVGWEATTKSTSRLNSRATITFCWLPPDNAFSSTSTLGVRTSYCSTNRSASARATPQSMTMLFENGSW